MKRLYIFIFLVGLLGNNIMYAQIPASSQSLPSPNVAALGLYGEIPVSKFTGMPDISVPLYEVPVGDLKLPFSLNYHAAGIRPDQHPGWVGMGWNLNTGGVVSRTVKGKPDDCNVKNHTYLMNMGYYFHSETLNTPQWNTQDYLKATAQSHGIYTFGPTFRAENSNTTRHAAEFWMIEPEIAFADLEDDMILAESMLKYIINYVLENAPEEMAFFNNFIDKGLLERLQHVANSDFARVTYTEAVEILEKHNDKFEYKVSWGTDLQTEHERYLTEEIFKRPVFVTDYPKEIKAFYMKMNDDGKTVAAVDCLVPGIGEIIGGSQREDDYDKLLARINELGLKEEDYQFYLDLRKYGSARHAGFGLGFERCVMYLTGMSNIRDVIPFPRTVNNCEL